MDDVPMRVILILLLFIGHLLAAHEEAAHKASLAFELALATDDVADGRRSQRCVLLLQHACGSEKAATAKTIIRLL